MGATFNIEQGGSGGAHARMRQVSSMGVYLSRTGIELSAPQWQACLAQSVPLLVCPWLARLEYAHVLRYLPPGPSVAPWVSSAS